MARELERAKRADHVLLQAALLLEVGVLLVEARVVLLERLDLFHEHLVTDLAEHGARVLALERRRRRGRALGWRRGVAGVVIKGPALRLEGQQRGRRRRRWRRWARERWRRRIQLHVGAWGRAQDAALVHLQGGDHPRGGQVPEAVGVVVKGHDARRALRTVVGIGGRQSWHDLGWSVYRDPCTSRECFKNPQSAPIAFLPRSDYET